MQLVANAATLSVLSSVNDTDEEVSIPSSIGRPILYIERDKMDINHKSIGYNKQNTYITKSKQD